MIMLNSCCLYMVEAKHDVEQLSRSPKIVSKAARWSANDP